jgi:hypothetical protein
MCSVEVGFNVIGGDRGIDASWSRSDSCTVLKSDMVFVQFEIILLEKYWARSIHDSDPCGLLK